MSPTIVDAGGTLSMRFRVISIRQRDLRGWTVRFENEAGAAVAVAALPTGEGDGATGALEVKAPPTAGSHLWRAILAAPGGDVQATDGPGTTFAVEVRPQQTMIAVWDVPPAVVAGAAFSLKVGVKASVAGSMAGTPVTIHDRDGNQLAAAVAGAAIWPASDGLHVVELHLVAPQSEGLHCLETRASAAGSDVARRDASAPLAVRVVARPDVSLIVEAVDAEDGSPVGNARVVLHPYRAATGPGGLALLEVASGDYTLFVSAPGHETASWQLGVRQDMTWRAPLLREPPEDLARGYT